MYMSENFFSIFQFPNYEAPMVDWNDVIKRKRCNSTSIKRDREELDALFNLGWDAYDKIFCP